MTDVIYKDLGEMDLADSRDPEVILKAHMFGMDGPEGESSQRSQDDEGFGTPEDAIVPPLDPEQLARLSKISGTRRSCIEAIARNTVGLGYELVVAPGHEHDLKDPSTLITRATHRLEELAARDHRLGHPTFTEFMMAVKTDEEETGLGAFEVSRDKRTGQPDGIFHVPGKRVRRRKEKVGGGWILTGEDGTEDDAVRFYDFGDKVTYTKKGRPTNKLQDGRSWEVNELMVFRLYTSESRDYGLPRDVALAADYLADKLAVESNVSFFDSSGTPPTVIFVAGEESREGGTVKFKVPQQTVDRIAGTLKADAGHRRRVAIVPVPPGTKADVHQLGQVSDRDMGFIEFRKDNKSRILAAFRMAPIFISDTGSAGRYTAEVERAITLEQVFDPEQDRYEAKLVNTLLRDMGFLQLGLRFKKLAVENDSARRDSADKMAEVENITRREHRAAHGYGPLPEKETDKKPEDEGLVPSGWNDQLVKKEKPSKAGERRVEGDDNRGLRPGIGAREGRQSESELEAQAEKKSSLRKSVEDFILRRTVEQEVARLTPSGEAAPSIVIEKGAITLEAPAAAPQPIIKAADPQEVHVHIDKGAVEHTSVIQVPKQDPPQITVASPEVNPPAIEFKPENKITVEQPRKKRRLNILRKNGKIDKVVEE
jgi:capsid portal protein